MEDTRVEALSALEALMDAAWPAPERHDTGEWVLRAAGGVTQRANSVWPRVPAADGAAAVRDAASWYRLRRLPVIYQIFDHDGAAPLNAVLDSLGYTRQSETPVMSRRAEPQDGLPASAGVDIPGIPRRNGWNCGGPLTAAAAPRSWRLPVRF
jgi:N-acetylglutamate synthase